MAVRLSALRAGRTLPPGFFIFKDSWYSFLLEAESTPGSTSLKKGSYTYGVTERIAYHSRFTQTDFCFYFLHY
jgi:hypothetical protein